MFQVHMYICLNLKLYLWSSCQNHLNSVEVCLLSCKRLKESYHEFLKRKTTVRVMIPTLLLFKPLNLMVADQSHLLIFLT